MAILKDATTQQGRRAGFSCIQGRKGHEHTLQGQKTRFLLVIEWYGELRSKSPAFSWRIIPLQLKCVFEHTPSCLPLKATLVACSIALMVFVEGYEGQRIDWCLTFWSRPAYTVYLVQLCCFDHCGGCIPRLVFTIEALISSYFDELSMPDRLDTLRKMFGKWKSW